jgi:hypothetical protein
MEVSEEVVLEGIFGEFYTAYHSHHVAHLSQLSPNRPMFRHQMCLRSCKLPLQHPELLHLSCELSPKEQAKAMTKCSRWVMAGR